MLENRVPKWDGAAGLAMPSACCAVPPKSEGAGGWGGDTEGGATAWGPPNGEGKALGGITPNGAPEGAAVPNGDAEGEEAPCPNGEPKGEPASAGCENRFDRAGIGSSGLTPKGEAPGKSTGGCDENGFAPKLG